MTDRELSDDEISRMSTALWEQARSAIADGDTERGLERLDAAVKQWRSLQEYSINWITVLLSFISDELGEVAVERALRRTGDDFVRPRRDTGTSWDSLPAGARPRSSRVRWSRTSVRSRSTRTTRRSSSRSAVGAVDD